VSIATKVKTFSWRGVLDATLSDKFCQYSGFNKTDCHDIAEILLKVALNTINPNINPSYVCEEMSYKWQNGYCFFFLKSIPVLMLNYNA
jgi:hypothetical protein